MRPSRESRFIRLVLILFFVLAGGYALYEAQGLLYGPKIHLADTATSTRNSFIRFEGRAERITELRLNGTTISVTENGNFSEPYLLAPGSNRIIFEAHDARGRTTRETLDIIYRAPESPTDTAPARTMSATSSPPATSPEGTF